MPELAMRSIGSVPASIDLVDGDKNLRKEYP